MYKLKVKTIGMLSVSAVLILTLSSCSTFRNRNFDYLREPVTQQPTVQVPQGVNKPAVHPVNVLPAGPNEYAPTERKPMYPPGYDQVLNPKTIPKDTETGS